MVGTAATTSSGALTNDMSGDRVQDRDIARGDVRQALTLLRSFVQDTEAHPEFAAEDLSHANQCIESVLRRGFRVSAVAVDALHRVDFLLTARSGVDCDPFWDPSAMQGDPVWQEVRRLAAVALRELEGPWQRGTVGKM